MKTISEEQFENFLIYHSITFTKIPETSSSRPDYLIQTSDGNQAIFEIKEIKEDPQFTPQQSTRYVGKHIRDRIKEAQAQIQWGAEQQIPSILLIYNNLDPIQLFGTENHDFIAAINGDWTIKLQPDTGEIQESFRGKNKSFQYNKNTSFSALGRLRNGNITLFENPYAKLSLPQLPHCFEIFELELKR